MSMLVLKRRPGESIMVGPDIEVIILSPDDDSGSVRVGIVAPRAVTVLRKELLDNNGNRGNR